MMIHWMILCYMIKVTTRYEVKSIIKLIIIVTWLHE